MIPYFQSWPRSSSYDSEDLKKKRKTRGKLPQIMSQMKTHFLMEHKSHLSSLFKVPGLWTSDWFAGTPSVAPVEHCNQKCHRAPLSISTYLRIPFKSSNSWRNSCTVPHLQCGSGKSVKELYIYIFFLLWMIFYFAFHILSSFTFSQDQQLQQPPCLPSLKTARQPPLRPKAMHWCAHETKNCTIFPSFFLN